MECLRLGTSRINTRVELPKYISSNRTRLIVKRALIIDISERQDGSISQSCCWAKPTKVHDIIRRDSASAALPFVTVVWERMPLGMPGNDLICVHMWTSI